MNATKWHKRSAAPFKVEAHVTPRKVLPLGRTPQPGNFVPGVQVVLSGPSGHDDQSWLDITMTADEADELANRLHTHAKIARENAQ